MEKNQKCLEIQCKLCTACFRYSRCTAADVPAVNIRQTLDVYRVEVVIAPSSDFREFDVVTP